MSTCIQLTKLTIGCTISRCVRVRVRVRGRVRGRVRVRVNTNSASYS